MKPIVRRMGVATMLGMTACSPSADGEHGSSETEVHWSYEGDEGPERWADLSDRFALCREGSSQSPIDLSGAIPQDAPVLGRNFGAGTLTIDDRDHVINLFDNGHTIQITADGGTTLEIDGITFELVQFHFHSPSEHTIEGRSFPLEIHLVHRSSDGLLAVIGSVFEEGRENPSYELLVSTLPDNQDDDRHLEGVGLHADDLLPIPERYFRYDGSLTTPPCSEGVRWIVMSEPSELSSEQIAAFQSVLHDNHRPVQQRNSRAIGLVSR